MIDTVLFLRNSYSADNTSLATLKQIEEASIVLCETKIAGVNPGLSFYYVKKNKYGKADYFIPIHDIGNFLQNELNNQFLISK